MKKPWFVLSILILSVGCGTLPSKPETSSRTVFYPPLPQQPRLQFLRSISGEADLGKAQSALKEFIVGKTQSNALGRPYDIGASKGKIYMSDRVYRKIVILDLGQKRLSFLDDKGAGSLGNPSGIFVSPSGEKYVADMQRKQVVVFDADDNFSRVYGGPELFEKPVDVAAAGNRVYVVDIEKSQMFILDKASGALVKAVGEKGDLFKPTHIAVGADGDVFVNDAFNFRVQKFAPDGVFKATIGFHGDQIGGFARPKGLAVDKKNNLYAVDAAFENVQIFNDQGELLLFFGGAGNRPGSMYLPAGIAVDYENVDYFAQYVDPNFSIEYLIYVTNTYGDPKLNVYGFGHWIGEGLPE